MISKFLNRFKSIADHYQLIIALLIGLAFICINWGVEKVFDSYLFPHSPAHAISITIFSGFFILWIIKHYVLHEV